MNNYVGRYRRALSANSSATGFTAAAVAATTTKPTSNVLKLAGNEGTGCIPRWMKMQFIGLGNDDDAFSVRVIGWNQILLDGSTTLWDPVIAVEFAVVVGTSVGVAGSAVLATERYADTISIVANRQSLVHGTDSGGAQAIGRIDVFSPTGNFKGYAIMPIDGFELITWDFDQTTGTPGMNVLYMLMG